MSQIQPLASETTSSSKVNPVSSSTEATLSTKLPSIDDFDFGIVLGHGAYGKVVLATLRSNQKQYAAKILNKNHLIRNNQVKYVKTEKNILLQCDHPNIIKLLSAFQTKEDLYFVMEYCPNGDLYDLIQKHGSCNENSSQFILAEIISALSYLHNKNIIHRDLKPENLLFDSSNHLKLIDFGAAKELSDISGPSTSFCGTNMYVAPEVLQSQTYCRETDLWSLGCIIYQLFVGSPPFSGKSEFLVFQNILNLRYQLPPFLPEKLIEPSQRLGSGTNGLSEIMDHSFFTGIDWGTLSTTPPPLHSPFLPSLIPSTYPSNHSDGSNSDGSPSSPSILSDPEAIRSNKLLIEHGSELYPAAGKTTETKLESQVERGIVPLKLFQDYLSFSRQEKLTLLSLQKSLPFSQFLLPGELVLYEGMIIKTRGLSKKRRHMLLTDFPRIIYYDPVKLEFKGEINWSQKLSTSTKNNRHFRIHTPNRVYVLEDIRSTPNSAEWCEAVAKVKEFESSGLLSSQTNNSNSTTNKSED